MALQTSSEASPLFSWRYRFDKGDWKPMADVDMGVEGDNSPYVQDTGPLGVGKEIEIEVGEADAVDLLYLPICR